MNLPGSVELFQYWNRLRDGAPAPQRTDIEPADIRTLLADTFILEQDSAGHAVFRLAGTRLCAIHGRELKGFSFVSLWNKRDQRMVARLTHSVFFDKKVASIAFTGHTRHGRKATFEALLLPLEGGRENPRSLGIISSNERPFWLGAEPIIEATTDAVRSIDPDADPLFLKNRPSVEVPPLEPKEYLLSSHDSGPTRRIRHLMVIGGGRDL